MAGLGERVSGRKRVLVAITLAVVIVLAALTFVFPDRNGQIRTDLVVGDYFVLESNRFVTAYTIDEMDGDYLYVIVDSYEKETFSMTTDGSNMTKESFLRYVLFNERMYDLAVYTGSISQETPFGVKYCEIYKLGRNTYNIDEYGVIYSSAIGGNFWDLGATSLLYGMDYPPVAPMPSAKEASA